MIYCVEVNISKRFVGLVAFMWLLRMFRQKKKNKTSFSCRDWLKKGLYFVVIDMMQNGVINETEFQAHSTEFFLTLSSPCPNLSYHENEWVCCFLSNQRGTCILLPTLQS